MYRWEEIFLLTGGDVYCKKNAGVYLYIWSFQLWDFFSLHSRVVSECWRSQGFSLLFIISNTLSTVFTGAGMDGKLEHRKHSTVRLSPFRWDKWCFAFSISSLPKESDRKLSSPLSYSWEVIAWPCCKLFYWSQWGAQCKRLHIPDVGHTSWPFTGGLQRQCSEGSLRTNPLRIPRVTCASSLLQPFCRSEGQSQFRSSGMNKWTGFLQS